MQIYLSYRIEDSFSLSEQVKSKVIERFGRNSIIMDVANRAPIGMSITGHIRDTIAYCKLMIVLIGPEWVLDSETGANRFDFMSDPVRMEIEAALRHGVRIVPVLIKGATMPPRKMLPEALQGLYQFTPQLIEPDTADADIDGLLRRNSPRLFSQVNRRKLRNIVGVIVIVLVIGGIMFSAWFARYRSQRLPGDFDPISLWSGTINDLQPVAYFYDDAQKFAFQPGSSRMAIVTGSGELNIWNYRTGEINEFETDSRDLAHYPNRSSLLLIQRTYSDALYEYRPDVNYTRSVFGNGNVIEGLAPNTVGSLLVTWGTGVLTVWHVGSESILHRFETADTVIEAAFTGDSNGLWILSREKLSLWDLTAENASLKASYSCETCRLYDMVVDPDKDVVYAIQSDRLVQLMVWDGLTDAPEIVLDSFSATTMDLSPDGALMAFGSSSRITFWDTETWDRRANILNDSQSTVSEIRFDPSGRFVATHNTDGTIILWGVDYSS